MFTVSKSEKNDNPVYLMDEQTVYTDREDRLEVVVVNLKPDTRYRVQVAGYTKKGDGMRSDSIFVTTKRIP